MLRVLTLTCTILFFSLASIADPSIFLWQAAKEGDLKKCKSALKKGALVNTFGQDGTTPLWQAAYLGHAKTVEFLLNHGANSLLKPLRVDESQKNDETVSKLSPRFWATKLQISNSDGALPTTKKMQGGSPRARKIIERKEPIDLPLDVSEEETSPFNLGLPIHVAVRNRHINVINALLKFGDTKQIKAFDYKENTPVHIACSLHDLDIFGALTEPNQVKEVDRFFAHLRTAVNTINVDGLMPLHIAIEHGGIGVYEMVKRLIDIGVDVNAETVDGRHVSPLDLAAYRRSQASQNREPISFSAYSYVLLLLTINGATVPQTNEQFLVLKFIGSMIKKLKDEIMSTTINRFLSDEENGDPLRLALINLAQASHEREGFSQRRKSSPILSDSDDTSHYMSGCSTEEIRHRLLEAMLRDLADKLDLSSPSDSANSNK